MEQKPTNQGKDKSENKVPEKRVQECINFLKQSNLLNKINEIIGKAGVVGEEKSRLLLFIIASSYKMPEPLHAIVQGTSGSGKTTQIKTIAELIPKERRVPLTRVTENSFYYYGEYELAHTLVVIEDADGLEPGALFAFRELQSNGFVSNSGCAKQDNSNEFRSGLRIVRGPFASITATTKGEFYEDNMGRSFILSIDESQEQTQKVIMYQNQKAAGKISEKDEKTAQSFMCDCMRMLKAYEVVNPFAEKIQLPDEVHQKRRLNQLFQSTVKQITLLKQYQRKTDEKGRLIAEKEDIEDAIEILFESIVLKVDELDGSLRQFFERIKAMVESKKNKEYEFNRFDAMGSTGMKKSALQVNLNKLVELEYVKQFGFANKGFKYKIAHWDNMETIRKKLKDYLSKQIEAM